MSYIQSEQKKKKRKDRSNRHSKISLAFFQLPIKAISATKQCHFFLFPVKLWSVFQLPPIVWLRTAEGLEPQAKSIIHCLKKKKRKENKRKKKSHCIQQHWVLSLKVWFWSATNFQGLALSYFSIPCTLLPSHSMYRHRLSIKKK